MATKKSSEIKKVANKAAPIVNPKANSTVKKAPVKKVETNIAAQDINNEVAVSIFDSQIRSNEESQVDAKEISRPRKTSIRPKRTTMANTLNANKPNEIINSSKDHEINNRKFVVTILLSIFLSASVTYGITHKLDTNGPATTTFLAKISGGVALDESELKSVVTQLKRTVYWTGPQNGAKYTINALTDGQTYIRYLPDGKGVSDTAPNYRTVGTYESKDAYTATLAAGNEANGVSFTTADGRVIHYNKSSGDNVYVAYKALNFQIEIFDPKPGYSLKIANNNELKVIK